MNTIWTKVIHLMLEDEFGPHIASEFRESWVNLITERLTDKYTSKFLGNVAAEFQSLEDISDTKLEDAIVGGYQLELLGRDANEVADYIHELIMGVVV